MTTKEFHKLTPARQRVAIARDAVAQIKSGAYTPERGTYLFFEKGDDRQVNQATMRRAKDCTVCALGAVFVSAVRLGNEFDRQRCGFSSFDMRWALHDYFPHPQLVSMESYFERWDDFNPADNDERVAGKAKARALKIFRNIIRNKGEFKPND